MARINFLPPWVETNLQPAFYDLESGTCLQQTARMYDKVNQLVRSVNEQNETIADYIQQFIDLKDYVEDYFDNLDVQQEINNKLDTMVQDGTLETLIGVYIQPRIDAQNAVISDFEEEVRGDITEINNAVSALASGSPIPVADISDMTDTTKTYVLTSDGNWYYYDGDSWEIGGAYQSTGIANGSIDILKLDNPLQANFVMDYSSAIDMGDGYVGYYRDTGALVESSDFTNYHVALTAGKIYTFTGRNIVQLCALVVKDSSNNVVLTTTTGNVTNNVNITFKCNDNNLTAYISKQNSNPQILENVPIFRELTSISNALKYSASVPLIKTYAGYVNCDYLANDIIRLSDTSSETIKAKVYQLCKGRTYRISAYNYAKAAGYVICNNNYEILEASSTATVGNNFVEATITYTPTVDGYIIISEVDTTHTGSVTVVNYGITVPATNVLTGKKLAVTGDSICAGAGYGGGYAGIIGLNNNMTVQNIAVGGGTVTSGTTSGGNNRFWINESITSLDTDADYVLIEGGLNDAGLNVTMGTITSGYGSSFDTDTYIGAFENMCFQLTKRFKGKKYGYVFVHQCFAKFRHSNADDGTSYYWEAKKVLEKWCIPYIDLNIECPPFGYFQNTNADLYAIRTEYTKDGDGTHPNEAGYKKYYVDKITSFLKSL